MARYPSPVAVPTDADVHSLRQRVKDLEKQLEVRADEIAAAQEDALRYRRYFNFAQIGMTVTSLGTGWIDFNQQLCEQLGYTPEELRGTNWVDLTHPDDVSLDKDLFEKLVRGEIQRYSLDKRFLRKDGSIMYGNILIQGVYRPDGSFDHIFGFLHDVTERLQNERERLGLKQEIIDTQKKALRELSTPLIPVAKHVLVMPLVGTIDSVRAQAVLETLLEGVTRYQARMTILDITGVQVMDSEVTSALVKAAQAVELLGAQAILTGIQPGIAKTLVELDAELSNVMTLSTVREGISYALGRLHR
ncbi:STAS domain-containing protein [Polyangium jinanense]|uniref:PAS domain S-box protein n=1 Tax=Polyangium jinanense TaxID=2829994 RepID=A0A9X3X8K6_9BACT|nr:PAS domain S-box protein [Polyangium jinanense]MDC3960014.1 PAS domain S-box protein [Polyangium jinanense]MDC3986232.1 PAS domain S-box protein [Polyangium jinanense]